MDIVFMRVVSFFLLLAYCGCIFHINTRTQSESTCFRLALTVFYYITQAAFTETRNLRIWKCTFKKPPKGFSFKRRVWIFLAEFDMMTATVQRINMTNELEGNRMEELNKEKIQQASGGVYEDAPHCPKCQSTDLVLIGPVDIGTPPCYRCNSCGYEWMLAL